MEHECLNYVRKSLRIEFHISRVLRQKKKVFSLVIEIHAPSSIKWSPCSIFDKLILFVYSMALLGSNFSAYITWHVLCICVSINRLYKLCRFAFKLFTLSPSFFHLLWLQRYPPFQLYLFCKFSFKRNNNSTRIPESSAGGYRFLAHYAMLVSSNINRCGWTIWIATSRDKHKSNSCWLVGKQSVKLMYP